VRALNGAWLRHQLRRLTRNHPDQWVFWTRFPSPELVQAIAPLRFAQIVYEPIDRYTMADTFTTAERRRIARAESALLKRATVITGGQGLANHFREARGGSHWLPFGTDLRCQPAGAGMPANVGRPRLGVMGRLDWRVDELLLEELAKGHPDWHLVLAGPTEGRWGRRLRRLPNVHWLGTIPAQRSRRIIADWDVALIPYRLTEWTQACLPVKLFEYLSEGKPVVATPLRELLPFADVVVTAPRGEVADTVAHVLATDTPGAAARRREAALRFTLQERARMAVALLSIAAPTASGRVTAPISTVVITRDEEPQIERCLASVQWTAERIVVDAHSRDRTTEFARRCGARVIQREWAGYAAQKNYAIAQATQPWILSVDADEVVTPALAIEIEQRLQQDPPVAAFRVLRPTFFLGQPLRHYGRERIDPGQVRLFRRGHGRFQDRLVHERVQVDGPIAALAAPLLHYSYPNLLVYWRKIRRYAQLEARERAATSTARQNSWLRAASKLGWMLLWRKGVLDGPRAWLWIGGQAYQEWLITRTAAHLQQQERARRTA
jgi:hypothetical protein